MIWDLIIPFEKEWFSKSVYLDFESIQVKASYMYDTILRSYYGDYMKLPSENMRHPNHHYSLYYRSDYCNYH